MYWISTGLVVLFLLLSAWSYLFHQNTIIGIQELGFPDFFRIQLAVLKIIAAIVLVLPMISAQAKEWAYAGVGLFLITAIVAHWAHKDPAVLHFINLAVFALLVVSNYTLIR